MLSSLCVLKVGANIDPQFSKIFFIKNIQMISIRFNLLSAQAGKPVPPEWARGSVNFLV
jgi:hypothetical protein